MNHYIVKDDGRNRMMDDIKICFFKNKSYCILCLKNRSPNTFILTDILSNIIIVPETIKKIP